MLTPLTAHEQSVLTARLAAARTWHPLVQHRHGTRVRTVVNITRDTWPHWLALGDALPQRSAMSLPHLYRAAFARRQPAKRKRSAKGGDGSAGSNSPHDHDAWQPGFADVVSDDEHFDVESLDSSSDGEFAPNDVQSASTTSQRPKSSAAKSAPRTPPNTATTPATVPTLSAVAANLPPSNASRQHHMFVLTAPPPPPWSHRDFFCSARKRCVPTLTRQCC